MEVQFDKSKALKEIMILSIEVFGEEGKAERWLNSYNLLLSASPIESLKDEESIINIKKILYSIAYGLCA